MLFLTLFWGEGSPTKIDCRKKGTLILTSLLEDLLVDYVSSGATLVCFVVGNVCLFSKGAYPGVFFAKVGARTNVKRGLNPYLI